MSDEVQESDLNTPDHERPARFNELVFADYADGGWVYEVYADPFSFDKVWGGEWCIDDTNGDYAGEHLNGDECAAALCDYLLNAIEVWMGSERDRNEGWALVVRDMGGAVKNRTLFDKIPGVGLQNVFGLILKEYDRAQTNAGPAPGPG